jgi:hypothetical protein
VLIIVDANCAAETLSERPSPDFKPVLDAVIAGTNKLAIGGSTLNKEYQKLKGVWRFIRILDQAGRTQLCSVSEVDREMELVKTKFNISSDDPHVLALARISGARILCSRDKALHGDFGNPGIINKPRGKVYQNATHARLLTQS